MDVLDVIRMAVGALPLAIAAQNRGGFTAPVDGPADNLLEYMSNMTQPQSLASWVSCSLISVSHSSLGAVALKMPSWRFTDSLPTP